MKTNLNFCINSYLMYRTIVDQECQFSKENTPWFWTDFPERIPVNTAEELDIQLSQRIHAALENGPVALMLSSGMDSAILAKYLPAGTQAYTLRCMADSGIDETQAAKVYAEENHLKHTIIDIYWKDYEKYTLPLMRQKGYPIHSIEVQIYKAAMQAKADGIKTLIFGETADIIYGGHSKLLSREWTLDEFTERFSFVDTNKVLKHPMNIQEPILPYVQSNGLVDVFSFLNGFEYPVSLGFYNNACRMADVNFFAPYSYTILGHELNMDRIRTGDSKYVVRELFRKLYPNIPTPVKTPLPRPMAEWLYNWTGPLHSEFLPNCLEDLTGDQKWYIYAMNEFLFHIMEEC